MKNKSRRVLGLALVLASASALAYLQRDWILARTYLIVLESEDRVRELEIPRVIDALGLEPGQRVADIGAGTGIFTRPFASAVAPDGLVYAVDVNDELLEHIAETARQEGLGNIEIVRAADDDPLIPEAVDVIFICDTLHHIEGRPQYLKTVRRYLKPSGRLAIIDFEEGVIVHASSSLRFSRDALDTWAKTAGYQLEASHDFVGDNFFVIYQCPGCPAVDGQR